MPKLCTLPFSDLNREDAHVIALPFLLIGLRCACHCHYNVAKNLLPNNLSNVPILKYNFKKLLLNY